MFHNYTKCFLSIMNTFCTNPKLHNCSRCCLKPLSLMIEINMEHFHNNNLWTQINRHIYTQFTPPPSTSMKTDTSKYCVKYGWRHFYNKSIKIWQVVHKFVTRTTVISSHVCPDLSHFQCSDTAVSLLLVA